MSLNKGVLMIDVIIADDEILLRESLGFILNNDDTIHVVGLAKDGDEVLELSKKLKPDVILMDIKMPHNDGINSAKIIKNLFPNIKIIMLTTFESVDNITESFVIGADGYILKNVNHEDIILAIKCVYRNLTVIHESVKKIMIDRFKISIDFKSNYKEILNDREIRIIKNIAKGKSNKEIASILNYSEGTIKNNVSKILEKLELDDRIQIAIFAIENDIV